MGERMDHHLEACGQSNRLLAMGTDHTAGTETKVTGTINTRGRHYSSKLIRRHAACGANYTYAPPCSGDETTDDDSHMAPPKTAGELSAARSKIVLPATKERVRTVASSKSNVDTDKNVKSGMFGQRAYDLPSKESDTRASNIEWRSHCSRSVQVSEPEDNIFVATPRVFRATISKKAGSDSSLDAQCNLPESTAIEESSQAVLQSVRHWQAGQDTLPVEEAKRAVLAVDKVFETGGHNNDPGKPNSHPGDASPSCNRGYAPSGKGTQPGLPSSGPLGGFSGLGSYAAQDGSSGERGQEDRSPPIGQSEPICGENTVPRFCCVFNHTASALPDGECAKMKRYVSQLKRHHERHRFFYCCTCFRHFSCVDERARHATDNIGCYQACVTPGCPNNHGIPAWNASQCSHRSGKSENSQTHQWQALRRMATRMTISSSTQPQAAEAALPRPPSRALASDSTPVRSALLGSSSDNYILANSEHSGRRRSRSSPLNVTTARSLLALVEAVEFHARPQNELRMIQGQLDLTLNQLQQIVEDLPERNAIRNSARLHMARNRYSTGSVRPCTPQRPQRSYNGVNTGSSDSSLSVRCGRRQSGYVYDQTPHTDSTAFAGFNFGSTFTSEVTHPDSAMDHGPEQLQQHRASSAMNHPQQDVNEIEPRSEEMTPGTFPDESLF